MQIFFPIQNWLLIQIKFRIQIWLVEDLDLIGNLDLLATLDQVKMQNQIQRPNSNLDLLSNVELFVDHDLLSDIDQAFLLGTFYHLQEAVYNKQQTTKLVRFKIQVFSSKQKKQNKKKKKTPNFFHCHLKSPTLFVLLPRHHTHRSFCDSRSTPLAAGIQG